MNIENEQMAQTSLLLEAGIPEAIQDEIKRSFPTFLKVVMAGDLDNDPPARDFARWLARNPFYSKLKLFLVDYNNVTGKSRLQEAMRSFPGAEFGKAVILGRRDLKRTIELEKPGVIYVAGSKLITISGQVFPLTKTP